MRNYCFLYHAQNIASSVGSVLTGLHHFNDILPTLKKKKIAFLSGNKKVLDHPGSPVTRSSSSFLLKDSVRDQNLNTNKLFDVINGSVLKSGTSCKPI